MRNFVQLDLFGSVAVPKAVAELAAPQAVAEVVVPQEPPTRRVKVKMVGPAEMDRLAAIERVTFDLESESFLDYVQRTIGLRLREAAAWDWLKGLLKSEGIDPRNRYFRILRGQLQESWEALGQETGDKGRETEARA